MLEIKDICSAYLEGYFYAKITEHLITDKIQNSNLDILKITLHGIKQRLRDSDKLFE